MCRMCIAVHARWRPLAPTIVVLRLEPPQAIRPMINIDDAGAHMHERQSDDGAAHAAHEPHLSIGIACESGWQGRA